jgi:RNA polymerase sigma factor (sigma-70 family)
VAVADRRRGAGSMSADADTALIAIMRDEWPRLIAASMRIVNDLQAAEDIVQDTLLTALDRWPLAGVPDQPGAWLMTACRRRALNAVRDRQRENSRVRAVADQIRSQGRVERSEEPEIVDDRLRLIVMCCHPVLPFDARVAMTLRMVAGLSTEQIAATFHEPTATTAQRLARAKKTLRANRIAFATDDIDVPARVPAVLDVLALVFNEGYLAHGGRSLTRADLAAESYRLTTLLTTVVPDEPEPWALHALQSFHLSRWDTRTDDAGNLVTLDQQDRSRWDETLIDSGMASLNRARGLAQRPVRLLLEAELAACHAAAPTFEDTDWQTIVELYDGLMRLHPTPVVELNRAVAVAMRDGPAAAVPILDRLTEHPALARSHRVWAVRADLHRRLNHTGRADEDYRRALALVGNEIERAYLIQARQQLTKTKG